MVKLVELDNMSGPPYLCVFHLATAGQQGPNLGSDEEEIVAMIYIIVDKSQNKVVGVQQFLVKPNVANASEGFLSSEILLETSITEELIRKSLPLEFAILQFDNYARSLQIDPNQMKFVTDGELPLRQCLHPESCNKSIDLPDYYNTFIDLRKDFKAFYSSPEDLGSVREMIDYLRMVPETEPEFYLKEAKDMLNITQRLIADGYRFNNLEVISIQLEPGLCSKDEEVDPNSVVRARGLPWQSSDGDIARFFRGLNIEKGGVALCLSPAGRRNGEALVRFVNQAHRDMALKRHKHHMGQRYIEVYKSTGEEFVFVAGGSSTEAHNFLTRGGQVIIRMRGLPYECTAEQVLEFFRTGEHTCEVLDGEDGVLFVKKADGRATGDAFVLFAVESDAPKALSKHRERIGSRYIELFRSTTAEVQQVLNRAQEDHKTVPVQFPQIPPMPPPIVNVLPQQLITRGTRKDCIRLRGLPYEAKVEHILNFLGDYANRITYQGVHMVYNSNGQPSGEAFIQMDTEAAAFHAANQRHHQYMVFGKKQRYVEVFQCSGDDMNAILTGGQLSPKATPVLSSGIENNMPGVGLTVAPTILPPYYEPPQVPVISPPALTISPQPNVFLLNQIALQQQQNALAAASLIQKTSPKTVYTVPSPAYPQWPTELDPYGTLNNNIPQAKVTAATPPVVSSAAPKTVLANGQPADSMALVPVKPDPTKQEVLAASQSDLYPAYPGYPTYFLPPRVAMYPKLGFPLPAPVLVPQVAPVGVLGLKRSWDQAFPIDAAAASAAAQAAKRWQSPQVPSFAAAPGFYHEV